MKVFFTLPDKEKDYQSHMVYVLTIIWSVTIAVVVTATWAMFPGLWQRYLLFFSVAVFIWAFNLSINRWVSTQLASWTLPITCWLIVSLSCYTAGGIQSPHIITQLVVILTAAYLLGWRGGLAFGLLSAAIDFLYAWMASEGTLPEPTIVHTPLSRWIGALIPFGTLLVLQHYATNHLRSSLAATKREIEKRTEAEKEKDITLNNLGERVKELQTLYTVGNMLQDEIITLDKLVKQVAETLPPGWQYPEITAVRVCMAGKEYRTANYKSTPHSLQAETKTSKNTKVGIEVVYPDEMPQLDEGPFLKEERNLLNMLIDMLKVYLERRERTSELFDYRFALDKAAIVGISDVEGRFIYTNDNFTKASKYNRSELSGIHHSVIWSGYHPPGYFDELKIAMQDGKPFKGEFCNKAKDGSLYWVESTIVPFLDEDGKVYQYLSINYDITERKKIEEEIKASEEKFRNLVEQAGDAIFIIDPDVALLTEVNIAASKLLGYTREELLSLSFDQVFFPEDIAQNPLRFSKLSKERTSMVTERKMRRKDGTEVYTEINTGLLQGNNFICIVRDITERREAEEKLRRSEEMNRAMIENMQDGLLLLDSELKALYQSPSGERITGYTSEERLNGTSGLMAYPDDAERVKNILQKTLDNPNVPVHFESRAIHKSGKVVWLENTAINLLDNPSIGAVMINYSDITARVKAENDIKELNESLELKVVQRTEELYQMNTVLEHRNHEITDSINYAENIQRAILSKYEDCTRLFPQSFVLWMPKDVVSGDFYWCYSTKKYDFIAVVDCTGHGVPGALMSIIANQMLGKVVGSHGFVEPRDILFHLDDAIISSLHQENGLVKDGMDMALCRVDKEKKELLFAGAQRPLYYHNGNELSEISGSKSGIGGFVSGSDLKIFSQTTIQYKQGDSFYLTSDGYYSQFGGEKGKKMMKKRFFELVSDIAGKPVSEQPELLRDYYIDWQNNEEQTDDVLVIGVKL